MESLDADSICSLSLEGKSNFNHIVWHCGTELCYAHISILVKFRCGIQKQSLPKWTGRGYDEPIWPGTITTPICHPPVLPM